MTSRRIAIVALLLTVAAAPLYAAFGDIERELRARLGSPTYIPFMGLIRVITWVAHPKGVHDVRLAVFEQKHAAIDGAEIERLVAREVPRGFHPLVRTWSKRSGEWSFIYAKPNGDRVELIIVSHDNSDTALVQVDVDPDVLMREIHRPHGLVASLR